jgi:hypothetical protein
LQPAAWQDWHRDEPSAGIASSSGAPAEPPVALPPQVAAVERYQPRYERLHAARLLP